MLIGSLQKCAGNLICWVLLYSATEDGACSMKWEVGLRTALWHGLSESAELGDKSSLYYPTQLFFPSDPLSHCTQSVRSSATLISIISFNALGRYWYLFLTCWLKTEALECVHSTPWPTKPSPWLHTLSLARKEQAVSQTFRMSIWMSLNCSLPVSTE